MAITDLQPRRINYFEQNNRNPGVEVLNELEARRRELAEMRRLVYAIYTADQLPIDVPTHSDGQIGLTKYVVAGLPPEGLVKPVPKNLLQYDGGESLQKFSSTGGFFGIEIAQCPNESTEAQSLFNWDKWVDTPNQRIAYLSEFSPHPQLTHDGKVDVLRHLFNTCQEILARQYVDKIYIVLAPKIRDFVEETSQATLNPIDAPYNEPIVSQLREQFPKYWLQEPQLYIVKF